MKLEPSRYAVIDMRKVRALGATEKRLDVLDALAVLTHAGVLNVGDLTSFFVLMLKDRYSGGALAQYAIQAGADGDYELARDVNELMMRAGSNHPNAKRPD